MGWQLHEFSDIESLDQALCRAVTVQLKSVLLSEDQAVLAVSGGSTPAGFFNVLSQAELPWSDVVVTVVDERCVPQDNKDSNALLVRSNLIRNKAAIAEFLPLYDTGENRQLEKLTATFMERELLPLDVTILGMGTDGHTASLFPCAENVESLVDPTVHDIFREVTPTTAPHQRISFSLSALLQSDMLILHITGTRKREVLKQAVAGTSTAEMPIRAFLHHPDKLVDIFWAP